jgi:hypothetical protein
MVRSIMLFAVWVTGFLTLDFFERIAGSKYDLELSQSHIACIAQNLCEIRVKENMFAAGAKEHHAASACNNARSGLRGTNSIVSLLWMILGMREQTGEEQEVTEPPNTINISVGNMICYLSSDF